MPQSLSAILIHLIFSTKRREPFILPDVEAQLHAYLAAVLRECSSPSILINGTTDHVHILFALSRIITVSDIVEEIKKRSSKWIKTKGNVYSNFQWQTGYGAFSIGQSNIVALKKFIAARKEHHRHRSFQEEYGAFLIKYKIELDERYIWD